MTHLIDRIYELEVYREGLRRIGKLTETQRQQIAAELAELRQRLQGITR